MKSILLSRLANLALLFLFATITTTVFAIDPCTPVPLVNGKPQPLVQGKSARIGPSSRLTERSHMINGMDSSTFGLYHKDDQIVSDVIYWSNLQSNNPPETLIYTAQMDYFFKPNTMEVFSPNQGAGHVMYTVITTTYTDESMTEKQVHVDHYYGEQSLRCWIPYVNGNYPDEIHGQQIF